MKKTLLIIGMGAFLFSCSKKEVSNDEMETKQEPKVENCTYQYAKDSTRVSWTAYKFTEKVGVNGRFDDFEVTGNTSGKSLEEIVQSIEFKIPVASVNSNHPERDKKIKEYFFGSLAGTEFITGKVKSLSSGGKAVVTLTLNETEKELEMEYEVEGEKVSLSSVMNVDDWGAMIGIEKLNEVCEELHKGTDGLSKLWPEVKLSISSKLVRDCQ